MVVILGQDKSTSVAAPAAMTLVARITFVVLVGATFAAFFVAQRLKSAPPVINVNRSRGTSRPTATATRTVNAISVFLRKARRGDDRRRRPRRRSRPAARRWCARCAPTARPRALGRQGRRRRAGPRRPLPRARLPARRGPLGDRPGHDDRGHAGAALGGVHRRPVPNDQAGRVRQHRLPGRPRRSTIYIKGVSRFPDALQDPAHRRRQAARGRAVPDWTAKQAPLRLGRPRRRQAARARDLHRPGAGARHGAQRRPHARGDRAGRRHPRPARA